MFKRISSFLLIIILLITVSFPAFAQTDNYSVIQEPIVIPISSNEKVEVVPIGYIENNLTKAQSLLTTSIIRDGNKEDCQIYLNWSGVDYYNQWKFSSCNVDNGSSLYNKVYGTIAGATKSVVASSTGFVHLGNVKIPTNVTQARVNISGLQGYNISTVGWYSATIIGKMGNIN